MDFPKKKCFNTQTISPYLILSIGVALLTVAVPCAEKEWELGFSSLVNWQSMEEDLVGNKAEPREFNLFN